METQLAIFFQKHLESFEKVLNVERLSSGASQETYRLAVKVLGVEKLFAFRRASSGGGGNNNMMGAAGEFIKISTKQEAQLIKIAKQHKVPAPEVLAICEAEDGLGEGFVMEWLEGETLGKKVLQAEALKTIRKTLAYQCGEILAKIHQISIEELSGINLSWQTPKEALAQPYKTYQTFNIPRPMIDYSAAWLKKNMPSAAKSKENFCLTHNDFRNGNLIISPAGIVAVLDWELACISDPMRDLGWLCANCWRFGGAEPVGGFGSYEDLFSGYCAAGGSLLLDKTRLKFWEVMSSFRWAIMCLSMAASWRSGVDSSVERAAIGRRVSESELDCANLLISQKLNLTELTAPTKNYNMPTQEELLIAVRNHLLAQRSNITIKRDRFLSLVAANSLDIALRELEMGDKHQALEQNDLEDILQIKGEIEMLRKKLIERIKNDQISLDDEKLKTYLRNQSFRQVLIDQPDYSGLSHAVG